MTLYSNNTTDYNISKDNNDFIIANEISPFIIGLIQIDKINQLSMFNNTKE